MNVPPPKPLEVVEGETIEGSATQPLGFNLYEFEWKKVVVFSIIYLLSCCAAWSWWTQEPVIQGVPGAGELALFVILLPFIFLFRAFKTIARLNRREKLVLGKDSFQHVAKQEQVLTQFPYRNIAHIEFVCEPGKEKYIGIKLKDLTDPDIFLAGDAVAESESEWHYQIRAGSWSMPIQQIYERLRKRLPLY